MGDNMPLLSENVMSLVKQPLITVDGTGSIMGMNEAAAGVFGVQITLGDLTSLHEIFTAGTVETLYRLLGVSGFDGGGNDTAAIVHGGKSFVVGVLSLQDIGSDTRKLLVFSEISGQEAPDDMHLEPNDLRARTFDTIPDYILVLDTEHRVLQVNPALAERLGHDQSDLVGKKCFSFLHDYDTAPEECPLFHVVDTGQSYGGEIYLRRLGGYFLVTSTPVTGEHGRVQGVIQVYRDITQMKLASNYLQRELDINTALAELSSDLIAPTIDLDNVSQKTLLYAERLTLSDEGGVLLFSDQDRTLVFAAHTDGIVVYPGVCFDRDDRKFSVNPDGVDGMLWKQALQSEGSAMYDGAQLAPYWPDERKEEMPGNMLIVPVVYGEKVYGLICVAQPDEPYTRNDIGALHRLAQLFAMAVNRIRTEERQRLMEERLKTRQKMESMGKLAHHIAHDFNNVLVGILGNADLALMDMDDRAALAEIIERIKQSALDASELTNQLFAYSGKGRSRIEMLDLAGMIPEILGKNRPYLSPEITIQHTVTKELPIFPGDRTQITHILEHLITNANEALGDGPGTIRITADVVGDGAAVQAGMHTIGTFGAGRYVGMHVTDEGCGMTRDELRQIFDPFYSTKKGNRGLGLSLVHGYVKVHNGVLAVSSTPGRGTTFSVYFPSCAAESRKSNVSHAAEPENESFITTVLVIDDEESVVKVASRMLRHMNMESVTAANGAEGVERFKAGRNTIDLVLLDLNMPGMSARETCETIKGMKDVPVLLISGYHQLEAEASFPPDLFQGFLQKPFQFDTFRETISGLTA